MALQLATSQSIAAVQSGCKDFKDLTSLEHPDDSTAELSANISEPEVDSWGDDDLILETEAFDSTEDRPPEKHAALNRFLQSGVIRYSILVEVDPLQRCQQILNSCKKRRGRKTDEGNERETQTFRFPLGTLSTQMGTIEKLFPSRATSEMSYM